MNNESTIKQCAARFFEEVKSDFADAPEKINWDKAKVMDGHTGTLSNHIVTDGKNYIFGISENVDGSLGVLKAYFTQYAVKKVLKREKQMKKAVENGSFAVDGRFFDSNGKMTLIGS